MSDYNNLDKEGRKHKVEQAKQKRLEKYANETPEQQEERRQQISAKKKEYRQKYKEHIAVYNKAYREAHEEYFQEWDRTHRTQINERRADRRKNDPAFIASEKAYRDTHQHLQRARDAKYRLARRQPWVYVCRNVDGRVIYVGRGILKGRLEHHKRFSSWWPEVTNIKKRKCATWGDSLVLEALLIRKYQPRYNRQGVIM